MSEAVLSSFLEAAGSLTPQIRSCAEEIEQSRRLPLPLVEAITQAACFACGFRVRSAVKKLTR